MLLLFQSFRISRTVIIRAIPSLLKFLHLIASLKEYIRQSPLFGRDLRLESLGLRCVTQDKSFI
jgi:hypothetical protein